MVKFFGGLLLVVHGCFALALQHFFPDKLVRFLAPKKAAMMHTYFPATLYPPSPDGPKGYLLATVQVLAGILILKSLTRL